MEGDHVVKEQGCHRHRWEHGIGQAIVLDERNMAYSTCIRCQTCDGFPCLVDAKSDAETVAVRPALEYPM